MTFHFCRTLFTILRERALSHFPASFSAGKWRNKRERKLPSHLTLLYSGTCPASPDLLHEKTRGFRGREKSASAFVSPPRVKAGNFRCVFSQHQKTPRLETSGVFFPSTRKRPGWKLPQCFSPAPENVPTGNFRCVFSQHQKTPRLETSAVFFPSTQNVPAGNFRCVFSQHPPLLSLATCGLRLTGTSSRKARRRDRG